MKTIGVGTFTVTEEMREYVNQVLDSGRISYGPMSRRFEREFADIHNSKFAVLSNSGTSSLHVALQAMKEIHDWPDGSRVIVPAVTFVATVNIVLHCGLVPVLVDVSRKTYNMDPRSLERKITNKVRAIIPVHLFGQPADMTNILNVANPVRTGIKVIEDSCECMFATHYGKKVGSLGDIGCFSTYVAHLVSTGVGGISTTDNPDYAAKMRSLVNHGRDGIYISIDDDLVADKREVISRRFNFESIGHSFRITELEAALGLAQLGGWEEMIAARRRNAAALTGLLMEWEDRIQLPVTAATNTHSWMMYPIVMRDEDKWGIVNYLEEHGIETREMLPLTRQPAYKGLWNPQHYPIADWINRSGFYVGIHQDLTPADIHRIAEVIGNYLRGPRKGVSRHGQERIGHKE